MAEAVAPAAVGPAAAGPVRSPSVVRAPSLAPIAKGSPVVEWWGGFAVRCTDCGHRFIRPTAEEAVEAATTRETHGVVACKEMAAQLTSEERDALEALAIGVAQGGDAPAKPKKAKAAKEPAASKSRGSKS